MRTEEEIRAMISSLEGDLIILKEFGYTPAYIFKIFKTAIQYLKWVIESEE